MVDFDKLFSSRPVNRQAGVSVSTGEHYEPKINKCRETWDAPLKCKPVPPDAPNLIGRQFGKLTVVGLADLPTASAGASWLVRCFCGKYEIRKSKAVRNPKNFGDQCSHCFALVRLKYADWERQFGAEKARLLRDSEIGRK